MRRATEYEINSHSPRAARLAEPDGGSADQDFQCAHCGFPLSLPAQQDSLNVVTYTCPLCHGHNVITG